MGRGGPRRNRREVAGPAAGPRRPMAGRPPNRQPAVSLLFSWDSRGSFDLALNRQKTSWIRDLCRMTGAYTDGILMIYGPLFCGVRYLSFACKETIVTHTKWMRFGVWLILSSVPSANAGAAGSLNQLESLGGLSSENYGQVFDGRADSPAPVTSRT